MSKLFFHLLAMSGCSQSPVCSSKTRWFWQVTSLSTPLLHSTYWLHVFSTPHLPFLRGQLPTWNILIRQWRLLSINFLVSTYRIRLLKEKSSTLFTSHSEWQTTLLTDGVKHETIFTQELRAQVTVLVTHVEPVTLLLVRDEVSESWAATWWWRFRRCSENMKNSYYRSRDQCSWQHHLKYYV